MVANNRGAEISVTSDSDKEFHDTEDLTLTLPPAPLRLSEGSRHPPTYLQGYILHLQGSKGMCSDDQSLITDD